MVKRFRANIVQLLQNRLFHFRSLLFRWRRIAYQLEPENPCRSPSTYFKRDSQATVRSIDRLSLPASSILPHNLIVSHPNCQQCLVKLISFCLSSIGRVSIASIQMRFLVNLQFVRLLHALFLFLLKQRHSRKEKVNYKERRRSESEIQISPRFQIHLPVDRLFSTNSIDFVLFCSSRTATRQTDRTDRKGRLVWSDIRLDLNSIGAANRARLLAHLRSSSSSH
jgi:hypothetical protein